MRNLRTARSLALSGISIFLAALCTAGCGGGDGPPTSPVTGGRTGTALFYIDFPAQKKGRVIPDQTRSIVLTVTGEGLDRAYIHKVERPAGQARVEVPMVLPIGNKTLKAEARSQTGGAGAILASGSTSFELTPDDVKTVDLEMRLPNARWRFKRYETSQATYTFHVRQTSPYALDAIMIQTVEVSSAPTELELGVPAPVTIRTYGSVQVIESDQTQSLIAKAILQSGNPYPEFEKQFGTVPKGTTKTFDVFVTGTVTIPEVSRNEPIVGFIGGGTSGLLPSGNGNGATIIAEYERLPD